MRLEMIGTSIIFCVALLVAAVLRIDAGLSGLALSTAMELTSYMNWAVRPSCRQAREAGIVSDLTAVLRAARR